MTGEQIYLLGKKSAAAKACIPLEFSHTPPRISFRDGWIAEFWYYTDDALHHELYEPQFYLALELPSGHPVRMERLRKKAACIGAMPELIRNIYYKKLTAYLAECARLFHENNVDAAKIESLQMQWLETNPIRLKEWLVNNIENVSVVEELVIPVQADTSVPENMVAYWKQEMAKAIREGNTHALRKAQQEMEKARNNK